MNNNIWNDIAVYVQYHGRPDEKISWDGNHFKINYKCRAIHTRNQIEELLSWAKKYDEYHTCPDVYLETMEFFRIYIDIIKTSPYYKDVMAYMLGSHIDN